MAKSKKKDTQLTGRVVAHYPHLNKPDDRYNPDKPEYKVSIIYENEEAASDMIEVIKTAQGQAVEDAVNQAREEAKKKGKKFNEERFRSSLKLANLPIKEELDEDDDPTGRIIIGPFKMRARGVTKDGREWERECPVFDGAGKPVDLEAVSIWGGSILNICYFIDTYYTAALGAGVSLKLEAVQVLELRSGKAKTAAGFGFNTDGEGLAQDDDAEYESSEGTGEEDDCPF
jgi:hypothetical protein